MLTITRRYECTNVLMTTCSCCGPLKTVKRRKYCFTVEQGRHGDRYTCTLSAGLICTLSAGLGLYSHIKYDHDCFMRTYSVYYCNPGVKKRHSSRATIQCLNRCLFDVSTRQLGRMAHVYTSSYPMALFRQSILIIAVRYSYSAEKPVRKSFDGNEASILFNKQHNSRDDRWHHSVKCISYRALW